jgi:type I restriction-modification system DNA methylase subunit
LSGVRRSNTSQAANCFTASREAATDAGVDPEGRDEYLSKNVVWLPQEARWGFLRARARSPEIGKRVNEAMVGIESANPVLRGVLPRDYARRALDKARLGQLVDRFSHLGLGGKEHQARDTLGRGQRTLPPRLRQRGGPARWGVLHADLRRPPAR